MLAVQKGHLREVEKIVQCFGGISEAILCLEEMESKIKLSSLVSFVQILYFRSQFHEFSY